MRYVVTALAVLLASCGGGSGPVTDVSSLATAQTSVTLSWEPPTENTDGSVLSNLAGYKIYYGSSADSLDKEIKVNNAGITRYVVDNLAPTTWFFVIVAYNSAGTESMRSEEVSRKL